MTGDIQPASCSQVRLTCRWSCQPETVSLIRLTALSLTARSNPVNLPFFPVLERGRKVYPRKSKDTGPAHGPRRLASLQ